MSNVGDSRQRCRRGSLPLKSHTNGALVELPLGPSTTSFIHCSRMSLTRVDFTDAATIETKVRGDIVLMLTLQDAHANQHRLIVGRAPTALVFLFQDSLRDFNRDAFVLDALPQIRIS